MSPTSEDIKLYVSISIWSSFGLWDDRYVLLLPDSSCVAGLGRSSVLLCCRTGTVVYAIVLPDWDGSICYCVAGLGRSFMLLCCRTGTVVCAIVLPDRDGRLCYGKKWLVAAARLAHRTDVLL